MGIFVCILDALLISFYNILLFHFFADKRNKSNTLNIFAAVVLGCLYGVFSFVFVDWFYLKAAAIVAVTSFLMFLLFQIGFPKSLVLSTFCYGVQLAVDYVVFVIIGKTALLIAGRQLYLSNEIAFSVGFMGSRAILLGIILWTGKKLGKKHDVFTGREWWCLFAISFITIFFVASLVVKNDLLYAMDLSSSYIYIAIGIVVINSIVCYLVYSIMEREVQLREHAVFREKVKSETAMYRSISENLEKQRKRTHEFKNQIAAIRALAADKQYQELNAYLEKIDNAMLGMDAIDANHVIVNAILNTKYREAGHKGIVFVLKVNDLSSLKMAEEDSVVILSNLLNNALEAAGVCKDKIVKLKFVLEGEQAVISVKNSMATKPIVEDGEFQTTKTKEAGEHGIGIRNVVETVKKYGGKYVIDYDEENFQITILIPNISV